MDIQEDVTTSKVVFPSQSQAEATGEYLGKIRKSALGKDGIAQACRSLISETENQVRDSITAPLKGYPFHSEPRRKAVEDLVANLSVSQSQKEDKIIVPSKPKKYHYYLNSQHPIPHRQPEPPIENLKHKKKVHSWLTEQDRNKWKEDWEQKQAEANQFTHKVSQIQKSIKLREQEKQRKLIEDITKEMDEKRKREMETAQEREEKKYQEVQRRKEEFEAKRRERMKLLELVHCGVRKQAKMVVSEAVEMPELEKKKKEIQEKRNMYKPLKREDIEDHQRRFEEIVQKYSQEKKKEQEKQRLDAEDYMNKAEMEYKSRFTEKVVRQDKLLKNKQKEIQAQKKDAYSKKMTYAKIIKESYAPEANEDKAEEVKQNIAKIKHPVRKPKNERMVSTGERKDDLEEDSEAGVEARGNKKGMSDGEGEGEEVSFMEKKKK